MTFTWSQAAEGFSTRHTLVGTPFSVVASGGSDAIGYAGGRTWRVGKRHYVVYQGDRKVRACDTLADAKRACESRA